MKTIHEMTVKERANRIRQIFSDFDWGKTTKEEVEDKLSEAISLAYDGKKNFEIHVADPEQNRKSMGLLEETNNYLSEMSDAANFALGFMSDEDVIDVVKEIGKEEYPYIEWTNKATPWTPAPEDRISLDEDEGSEFMKAAKETSMVNHPNHYTQTTMETIEFMHAVCDRFSGAAALDIGNAIKYISRAPLKNKQEDIDKAVVYLNWVAEKPRYKLEKAKSQQYFDDVEQYAQEVSDLYDEISGYYVYMALKEIAHAPFPTAVIAEHAIHFLENVNVK